uniref:Uncharacterized protein n=1 Tax=Cannabis sativa TaxID=3483 RepID=A0A803NHD5_CANSA
MRVRPGTIDTLPKGRPAPSAKVEQARPPSEDTEVVARDVKVQEIKDQDKVRLAGPRLCQGGMQEGLALKYRRKEGSSVVPPPSILTFKRLTNLLDEGLLRGVEAFLPHPRQLATDLGEGFCAWSRPYANQGAILPLHPYFKEMSNYYKIYPTQFTPKGINDTMDKEVSKISGFIEDYYMVKDMDVDHLSFQCIPSYCHPPFTLGLRSRAQATEGIITEQEAPNKRKTSKGNHVSIERPIRIKNDPEEVVCPTVQVTGKRKVVVMEDDEDSSNDDALSLLVWEGAPPEV